MPQISLPKKLAGARVQCTVTFTPEETQKAEAKAVERLGEGIRIEGFRPGRAPAEMLRQKIDPTHLSEETVRILLPNVFQTILKEHKLQPIIPPKVDLTAKEPLTLIVTFVERPEVKVKGADKIKVKKTESKIGEKDIDRMVDYLKSQYRTTKPVDRAAKEGDELTVDFAGTADGKEVEGTKTTNYKLTIGSKTLIPGFEEALIGAKKGDSKNFTLTFPADYHAKHLQSKPVTFSATVHDVHEASLPELTDSFVKEHHLGESAKELRERIGSSLKEQEQQTEVSRREKELFEAIRSATVIDLAPELVAHEERIIFDEIARNLEREKLSLEDWLKQTNRTVEKFQKEMEEESKKRLTLRFAIQWLLDEKKIEASDDEIAATVEEVLQSVPEEEKKHAREHYEKGSDGYEELKWRKRVEKLVSEMLKD